MDLSVHAMKDEQTRTIFEDAEYFAKDYSYKLMPITFESVNETIIHIEHNYCHWVPADTQEPDESRGGAVNKEVEDQNYKRKMKSLAVDNNGTGTGYEAEAGESERTLSPPSKSIEFVSDSKIDDDCGISAQPLDLSLPLLQEQKTDKTLTENQSNIPKIKSDSKNSPDKKQLDLHESNKENVTSPKKIEVTVSRPGQKGYYEPCEVFLNDLAEISPDLIKNDCREIEIIDRTRGQEFQQELGRTYYIVLESTWRIFEDSTERIILTNDLNIGQPVQNNEKHDKPRYLIFDQYSLTESLAKICESKGGSFEYTCLEEEKEQPRARDNGRQESVRSCDDNDNDCSEGEVIFESESGRSEIRHSDANTEEEVKEKVPNDCASSLENTNSVETTSLENSDKKLEGDEAEIEQIHPSNPSRDEQFPQISEIPFVPEDKDSTQLQNESEICDVKSSTEPDKSGESNLASSELQNASIESNEIDKKCNSGSTCKEGAIELVKEEKCASDMGSGKTDTFSLSEPKRKRRGRISKKNSCAISEKIKKSNDSVKVENVTESVEVQRNLANARKQETTREESNSSFRSTRSREAQPSVKEEAEKVGKETATCLSGNSTDKEQVKVSGTVEMKRKSRGIKRKISSTDIKTRSSKQVSVLRSGKERCAPPEKAKTAKRERGKMDSGKISKPKSERTEEILKTRARTRKITSDASKKVCLRKRS